MGLSIVLEITATVERFFDVGKATVWNFLLDRLFVSEEVGVEGPVGSGVRGSGAAVCGGDGTIAR